MPVQIPEDAVWWQQLLAWTLISVASASMPVIIAWLNRIHRSLSDNTQKTEKIEHAVNGALSDRLKAMATSITDRLEHHLGEIDTRLRAIEIRVTRIEEREDKTETVLEELVKIEKPDKPKRKKQEPA